MEILVVGATGYIGARLVPQLAAAGHHVRALGRSMEKLRSRPWATDPRVELVVGDVMDEGSLRRATQGIEVVYYLVHSMVSAKKDFEEADRRAAGNMTRACDASGVSRIIYLGGLGDESSGMSAHMRSRAEVGRILGSGSARATALRAAVILGSGSGSFEIIRHLADRLPLMVAPRWLRTPVQPIAIEDVIAYLVGCLDAPGTTGRSFDIGGPEVTSYLDLIHVYSEEAGLHRRRILQVPVLTPRLSTYWIHLVTPAPAALVRPLAEGLRNPAVCSEQRIAEHIPRDPLTPREAIRAALRSETLESHWTDAGAIPPSAAAMRGDAEWAGEPILVDRREIEVEASAREAWRPIERIGGKVGWYFADALWFTRGALDKLVGGPGARRGRPRPHELRVGDVVDLWRVAHVEPGERVRLVAEMRLPGEAMLELAVDPRDGVVAISQTAYFKPRGVAGILYWYLLYPVHVLMFRGMLRALAREAESGDTSGATVPRTGAPRRA